MSDMMFHRAAAHRAFIGPEFDAGPDGEDPQALSYAEIVGDEKLAELGKQVYAQLRGQFSEPEPDAAEETPAEQEYRLKLEGWAEVLEILLEETLTELDKIGVDRRGGRADQGAGR